MIKKEEGVDRVFSTGASKQSAAGKGTPVLFPADAYLEIAKHFEEGAVLHGSRNWEKGIPISEIVNSLERHIAQFKMGETDERHDRAIAWNAIVLLALKVRIERGLLPDTLNDMPGYEQQVKEPVDEFAGTGWEISGPDVDGEYYVLLMGDGGCYKYLWHNGTTHARLFESRISARLIEGWYKTREEAEDTLWEYLKQNHRWFVGRPYGDGEYYVGRDAGIQEYIWHDGTVHTNCYDGLKSERFPAGWYRTREEAKATLQAYLEKN